MHYILRAPAAFLLLTVIAGLAGCASVPMATPEQDTQAKKFIPPADMAAVYLYRRGTYAADIVIPVGIDNQFMGRTAVDSYFYWIVTPGHHTFITGGYKPAVFDVDLEPGKNYFFKQKILFIYTVDTQLVNVSEEQGKKDVLHCALAASLQPKPVTAQNNDTQNLEDLRGLLQPQQ